MGGNYKSQDHSVLAHSLDKWCKDGLAKNLESNFNMLENLSKRSLDHQDHESVEDSMNIALGYYPR